MSSQKNGAINPYSNEHCPYCSAPLANATPPPQPPFSVLPSQVNICNDSINYKQGNVPYLRLEAARRVELLALLEYQRSRTYESFCVFENAVLATTDLLRAFREAYAENATQKVTQLAII